LLLLPITLEFTKIVPRPPLDSATGFTPIMYPNSATHSTMRIDG
jgi:hypothetical protein